MTVGAVPQSAWELSTLAGAGPQAAAIAQIWWVMAGGATAIFVLVMLLVLVGLVGDPTRRRWVPSRLLIVGGGVVFTAAVVVPLLIHALLVGPRLARPIADGDLSVQVIGRQWWWEVRYPGLGADGGDLISANELRIPLGQPIHIALDSADVIHSFWVPSLAGKIDMIPGRTNRLLLSADRAGVFGGQCAEFCGLQHTFMAFAVVAEPAEDYRAWLSRERQPAAAPATEALRRGHEAFIAAGCGGCHAVRGTAANGRIGPDLTHVGGRRSIGAGMLTNNAGTLATWIAGSQHIKPGNGMPSFEILDSPTLHAIAGWLESLK